MFSLSPIIIRYTPKKSQKESAKSKTKKKKKSEMGSAQCWSSSLATCSMSEPPPENKIFINSFSLSFLRYRIYIHFTGLPIYTAHASPSLLQFPKPPT